MQPSSRKLRCLQLYYRSGAQEMRATRNRRSYPAVMAITCFVCLFGLFGKLARAQSYLTSSGMPTFSAPDPVELGFADTANGNLHLIIHLGSFPQRGTSKPEEVSFVYDSNIWSVQSNSLSSWWEPYN